MRVLVAGAGVAGLAAARALLNAGHEVQVYERAPSPRLEGGSVTLWSGGTGILADLGVDLTGAGRRIDTMQTWNHRGRRLLTVDVAAVARRYGTPNVHLPRRHLIQRLAAGLPDGVLRFGHTCAHVDPERGELAFAGGGTARGDVVVGAEGRASVVRDLLWGADPGRMTGWITWQGYTTGPPELAGSHRALMVVGPQGLCGLIPAGEGRLLWWFDHRTDHREPPPASPAAALTERFGHWASPVPEVLARIGEADLFRHHRHRVPKVWGRGRATLAGDAAHSMPPTMAQGANQALEDAWTLARELDGPGPVADRLRRYERARSRRAARAANLAATEMTDSHRAQSLTRLLPGRLVTAAYIAWLRRVSTYLASTT
ncbi:FAD-dependent monooxygenase [Sphaerisporangium sp. TRM90804]|uniref:FAD-dependent monooxygenase n=1 Tax=Sphaerisporangium sp. TRM90804 TaxID=3031113 RepID=UPI002449D414|nr:FAD-dependent monooxygenase [Sphaerisporangium sp. TRM90804]MDH2430586.1 FAD-dependent monooxygenase [Sphaerisporangium sp. TRM90804]